MTTKFDARQTVSRDSLDQLTPSTGQELDNLLRSINSRVTPPVKLEATSTPSLVVNVGSILVTNPETSKNHTIPPISGLLPVFTSGTVTADATGAGNITPSVGSAIALSMTASQFLRVGINLNSTGSLVLMKGLAAGSLAAATAPADVVGAFAIGYVVIRTDGSNNVANILNSDVYQYLGGGSGSGSGSGELNLIATGSSTATDWTAATGATAVTSITAGDLPLAGLISTALKITSGTGASTEATLAQTNSYAFTTPASYAVKTKVELWMRPGTLFLPNEWTVSVYAGSTRQALTTDSSSITYLPNANGKFTTYFDAVASTAYTVRFTRKLNALTNAAVLNVANVIVGPGIQPQGAIEGPWQAYTPTLTGFGSAVKNFYWRQCGDSIEIQATLQASTPTGSAASFTLPNSWTAASIAAATSSYSSIGFWNTNQASAAGSVITPQPGTNLLYFGTFGAANSTSTGSAVCSGFNAVVTLSARLQINELAGSGTVNLAQNDVEYASNASTAGAADVANTASNVAGPAGALVPTFTSNVANGLAARYVLFQTPIQDGDDITIQVQDTGSGPWVNIEENSRYAAAVRQGAGFYGMFLRVINSTTVSVDMGAGGPQPTNATFAATAGNWPFNAGDRWRVRKVSGGQAVGFGAFQAASSTNPAGISGLVPALGLPGRTDGVAVAAGYVGEMNVTGSALRSISGGFTYSVNNSTANATVTPTSVASVTLNKGVYMAFAIVRAYCGTGTGYISGDLRLGATNLQGTTGFGANEFTTAGPGSFTLAIPVTITVDGTVLNLYTETAGSYTSLSQQNELSIVRIA